MPRKKAAEPQAGAAAGDAPTPTVNTTRTTRPTIDPDAVRRLQEWAARDWQYRGPVDGIERPDLWQAIQRFTTTHLGDAVPVGEGTPRQSTVAALQRYFRRFFGFAGRTDGQLDADTYRALARFASEVTAS